MYMPGLLKKVILTKDNLVKRNWHGCTKCYFCDQNETIDHLFISYPFARMIWHIVYMTFNIPPLSNITNLFGNWLNEVAKKDKIRIRVGVCALIWAVWNVRNDFIFNKKKPFHPSCRLSHWLLIGFICGPFSSRRRTVRPWILGATICIWLRGIYTVSSDGMLLED
jgi:hypothetical protein